jgi:hypothetical protein
MKPIGWRAWYRGGLVFDSKTTQWEDLPKVGVTCMCIFMDVIGPNGLHAREILTGKRRYFKAQGTLQEFYKGTLWQEKTILDTYDTTKECIKEGVWDDDESYARALAAASSAIYTDGDDLR